MASPSLQQDSQRETAIKLHCLSTRFHEILMLLLEIPSESKNLSVNTEPPKG